MKRYIIVVLICSMFTIMPLQAQFKMGVKAGINLTEAPTNIKNIKNGDLHTGFYVGPMVHFAIPAIGLGVEADILYSQAGVKINDTNVTRNSIEIPILLRYDLRMPAVSRIVIPFVAVGPQFGFTVGDADEVWGDIKSGNITSKYEFEKSNIALNIGLGVILFKRIQLQGNYNIALGKTANYTTVKDVTTGIKENFSARSNTWQASVTFIF